MLRCKKALAIAVGALSQHHYTDLWLEVGISDTILQPSINNKILHHIHNNSEFLKWMQ